MQIVLEEIRTAGASQAAVTSIIRSTMPDSDCVWSSVYDFGS